MAVNKRKILESAQKHLQKGALDKALEDYQTLLKADPKDSNTRLKVGDLHLKLSRTQDAIDAYLRVAQQFTAEGFDAKAVALYKQIAKLDDKRFEVHGQLGELYQRMGLAAEAMKAFQAAADGAHRAGDKTTALGLLRRMGTLDPTNTTNRLKVADLLRHEGNTDDAISEYEEVARELERQNNGEERLRVLERMLEIAPERAATLRAIAEAASASGAHEKACAAASKLAVGAPGDDDLLELLGKTLEAAGHTDDAAGKFRELAERVRARGDNDRARALLQRYGDAKDTFGSDESEPPVLEGDSTELELDASLGLDEEVLANASGGALLQTAEPSIGDAPEDTLDLADSIDSAERESAAAGPDPDSTADLDQLLAEASVFSRYGKHDRAVETLRVALRVEPGNPDTLEKLGRSLLALGNKPHAASALQRAGAAFAEAGDAAATARVREALKAIDPRAAASLAVPEPAPAENDEIDIDIDIDADPQPEPQSESEALTIDADDDLSGIEFGDGEPAAEEPLAPAPASPVAALEAQGEISFDTGLEEASQESAPEDSTVEADLEEAEFYAAQGLNDEARALFARVLEVEPGNERARTRMQDLEAAAVPEPAPIAEAGEGLGFDAAPAEEPVEVAASQKLAPEADERDAIEVKSESSPVLAPSAPVDRAELTTPDLLLEPAATGALEAPLSDDADVFDLAAELSGALEASSALRASDTEGGGFQEVFAAFKAGVKREMGEGDTEAHYDLGIAYKEMGLLEDAIGEFRVAIADPARKLACLHLMGVCALELGRPADAESHIAQVLASGPLPPQQEAALRIDLGRCYSALGDARRARTAYEAARTLDSSFEGVAALIAELDAVPVEPESPAPTESFESFDDLLGDEPAASEQLQPTPPAYESFDELLSEREDAEVEPTAPPAPEPEEPEVVAGELSAPGAQVAPDAEPELPNSVPQPEPEPEPERVSPPPPELAPAAATPAALPARRKKKISFV